MGTNYYCMTGRKAEVECDCGFTHMMPEVLHIGKDSYGWKFALHSIPEKGLVNLERWRAVLESSERVYDEYGDDISVEEMVRTIRKKVDARKVPRERRERMRETATREGYELDEKCWLFGGEIGRPQGADGNYTLMEGEFS